MPKLRLLPASSGNFAWIFDDIETIATFGVTSNTTPRGLTSTAGDLTATITGTGLTYREGGLTGGTINKVVLSESGVDYAVISNFGNVRPLLRAAGNEPADAESIESYLRKLDWTLVGSSAAERQESLQTTQSGVDANLRGDNIVNLKGGDDFFFGGRGADVIRGQAGDDILGGGKGTDSLFGGAGLDSIGGGDGGDDIRGGIGGDQLAGNNGADDIRGGNGGDTITGGNGADTMFGGRGADQFWFFEADGNDVVQDFRDGVDKVFFGAGTTFTSVADHADGILVTYTGGTIVFVGMTVAQWTPDDML